jgi:hypothetical protein
MTQFNIHNYHNLFLFLRPKSIKYNFKKIQNNYNLSHKTFSSLMYI